MDESLESSYAVEFREEHLCIPVGLERIVRLEAGIAARFLGSDVNRVVRFVQNRVHRVSAV